LVGVEELHPVSHCLWVVPDDVTTVLHVWVVVVRDLDAGGICLPRHVVYVEVVLALKVVHG